MTIKKIQATLTSLLSLKRRLAETHRHSLNSLLLLGKTHGERVAALPPTTPLDRCEFKVFSQNGEDGILQFLIGQLDPPRRTFIEFGVENYLESNTRYLLHQNWQGLVIDGSPEHVAFIRADDVHWRFDLQAVQAFITAENINDLIGQAGFDPDAGLLSVDIDGNDYWVWQAIAAITPRIVVVEYNPLFELAPVSIPYQADFSRTAAHYSNMYYGASLAAMTLLGKRKGYRLVGVNSTGMNAFFVREDVAGELPARTPEEAWRPYRIKDSRGPDGGLTFLRGQDRQRVIQDMPVQDVVTGERLTVAAALARQAPPRDNE